MTKYLVDRIITGRDQRGWHSHRTSARPGTNIWPRRRIDLVNSVRSVNVYLI